MTDPGVLKIMPRYKCHKEVCALRIGGIMYHADGSAVFTSAEKGYGPVALSREYLQKRKPYVGGFYVFYEDGYESFSPAEAFENGYTRIN